MLKKILSILLFCIVIIMLLNIAYNIWTYFRHPEWSAPLYAHLLPLALYIIPIAVLVVALLILKRKSK